MILAVLNDAKTEVFSSSNVSGGDTGSTRGGTCATALGTVAASLYFGLSEVQKPAWLNILGHKDDIRRAVKDAADELEIRKDV